MDLQLTGKRAVVTGGSRGIGLAIARALAAEGADVALVARDKAALEAARDTVAESGRAVLAISADTGEDEAVRKMVARSRTDSVALTSWSTPLPGPVGARWSASTGSATSSSPNR